MKRRRESSSMGSSMEADSAWQTRLSTGADRWLVAALETACNRHTLDGFYGAAPLLCALPLRAVLWHT